MNIANRWPEDRDNRNAFGTSMSDMEIYQYVIGQYDHLWPSISRSHGWTTVRAVCCRMYCRTGSSSVSALPNSNFPELVRTTSRRTPFLESRPQPTDAI